MNLKFLVLMAASLGLVSSAWAAPAHHEHKMPARSNKGGKTRGKARAKQVHEMNQQKKDAMKAEGDKPADEKKPDNQ